MGPTNKLLKICKLFGNLAVQSSASARGSTIFMFKRRITTTAPRSDLMEFFDHKDNWGQSEIKSGRSWRKEEMRLKSNSDLHKLWYVLLKEKNMLLTMEQECKDQTRLFPSPERIDKVEESMENLEQVVRERNRAYHELETGETGERPGKLVKNSLGLDSYYKMSEHRIPEFMNKKWREKHQFYKHNQDAEEFLLKFREKLYINKKRKGRREFNHVIGLMNRFPNMDVEALKQQYPDVDVKKAKLSRKFGGHFIPK